MVTTLISMAIVTYLSVYFMVSWMSSLALCKPISGVLNFIMCGFLFCVHLQRKVAVLMSCDSERRWIIYKIDRKWLVSILKYVVCHTVCVRTTCGFKCYAHNNFFPVLIGRYFVLAWITIEICSGHRALLSNDQYRRTFVKRLT